MVHRLSSVRSAALSLLIASPSTTRTISSEVLLLLKHNLPFLYSDDESKFRNELLSLLKQLLGRLRGGLSHMTREQVRIRKLTLTLAQRAEAIGSRSDQVAKTGTSPLEVLANLTRSTNDILAHIRWFIDFNQAELGPTSTYQRHITAIKVLMLMLHTGMDETLVRSPPTKLVHEQVQWPILFPVLSPTTVRALVDLLMDQRAARAGADPFEDVRSGAAEILKMVPPVAASQVDAEETSASLSTAENGLGRETQNMLISSETIARAKRTMQRTCRADHSDGLARCYELAFSRQHRWTLPARTDTAMTPMMAPQSEIPESLVSQLEHMLKLTVVEDNPFLDPMHGYLTSLR